MTMNPQSQSTFRYEASMSTDDTDPRPPEKLEDSERRSFIQGMVMDPTALSHSC